MKSANAFLVGARAPGRVPVPGKANGAFALVEKEAGKMIQSCPTTQAQSQLAEAVLRESGQNVNLCYQCRKCAAGCPISYVMDYKPAQLIHAIRLGMDDLVLNSKTVWLCASCETCTTRCPQEVDVAKVMDAVKITALRRGVKPAIPQVASFYNAALANIKKCGRMYELGMIVGFKLRTFEFFKDVGLGMKMFRKGKLRMVPSLGGALTTLRIFRRVKNVEKKNRNA
ncbi:MAG: 4Fe-4S dicluster domain-containing protein [Phycisphaerales bacterium]|nr:MAG: 4Fe-4S dicluster domain-containing protein [Phycisphaerales bacterium]